MLIKGQTGRRRSTDGLQRNGDIGHIEVVVVSWKRGVFQSFYWTWISHTAPDFYALCYPSQRTKNCEREGPASDGVQLLDKQSARPAFSDSRCLGENHHDDYCCTVVVVVVAEFLVSANELARFLCLGGHAE